ncbi:hypothetical protein [Portibacter lacus]|nr:hypothetical protein [Portibacter lacus]
MKTTANNVYDGHAQQKLVTPHIRDRSCKLTDVPITFESCIGVNVSVFYP